MADQLLKELGIDDGVTLARSTRWVTRRAARRGGGAGRISTTIEDVL
jgi:hypothetical protein